MSKRSESAKQLIARDEEEAYDEQMARGYMPSGNENDTMAQFLRHINTPELGRKFYTENGKTRTEGFKEVNKDLRLGFLPRGNSFEESLMVEMTDVAKQCDDFIGSDDSLVGVRFSDHLLMIRDTRLNITASRGGFERQQQNASNVILTKVLKDDKKEGFSIFGKKRQQEEFAR